MTALEALAGGRWRTLTILEQMGNIGSEVERTIRSARRTTWKLSSSHSSAVEMPARSAAFASVCA